MKCEVDKIDSALVPDRNCTSVQNCEISFVGCVAFGEVAKGGGEILGDCSSRQGVCSSGFSIPEREAEGGRKRGSTSLQYSASENSSRHSTLLGEISRLLPCDPSPSGTDAEGRRRKEARCWLEASSPFIPHSQLGVIEGGTGGTRKRASE